ncbi:MAG: hypothetical protein H7257_12185 [Taibaiella sp.]|nr:hypothetical protein [Taibaiella sp.]
MRLNAPVTGFLIGLVTPLMGLVVMYFIWGHHEGIPGFVHSVMKSHDLAGKVFSLSLLANLAPFVFLTSRRYDYAARGIFIATMLYVVFIVLVKYVW